jgi:hypothetical protein
VLLQAVLARLSPPHGVPTMASASTNGNAQARKRKKK